MVVDIYRFKAARRLREHEGLDDICVASEATIVEGVVIDVFVLDAAVDLEFITPGEAFGGEEGKEWGFMGGYGIASVDGEDAVFSIPIKSMAAALPSAYA